MAGVKAMRYLSVCSGVEAATLAWQPLGWKPAGFAEIDAFPSAVLKHHWPQVPNFGDFTRIEKTDVGSIDVLVGGTPCQSFSLAGLRGGLHDDRGNLALEYLKLVQRSQPERIVWENVPGVLSSLTHAAPDPMPPEIDLGMECDGQEMDIEDEYSAEELYAFECFLAGLSQCGYGWAYRVFDAQYFGVPQRRRRVIVIGDIGGWQRAAAVLFERESLSWSASPGRKARQDAAGDAAARIAGGGGRIECTPDSISGTVSAKWAKGCGGPAGDEHYNLVTIPIQSIQSVREKKQNGIGIGQDGDPMFTLTATDRHAIAFDCKASGQNGFGVGTVAPTLRAMNANKSHANGRGQVAMTDGLIVRRLTPRECERLQGMPDDHTLIPWRGGMASDGPRYKAIGNSMPVPLMSWVGRRIDEVSMIKPRETIH